MTILRIDAWQVKPERMPEVIDYARVMKPLIRQHGGSSPRLMRVTLGGTSTGLAYGEFEVADLEAHGRVIGSLQNDDTAMGHISRFHRSDGPGSSHEAALIDVIAEFGSRTESVPGCVELIRTFRIASEHVGEYLDLARELAAFTDRHDARFRILRGLTGGLTGRVSQVIELADMAAFGRYADDTWPKPAFQDLVNRVGSVAEHIDGSLHSEVTT